MLVAHQSASAVVIGPRPKVWLTRLPFVVSDPPVCQGEGKVIRAAIRQTLNITCDIDSNPTVSLTNPHSSIKVHYITQRNLTFKWLFNNTIDNVIELPSSGNNMDDNHVMQQIDAAAHKTKTNYNSIEEQQQHARAHQFPKKYQQQNQQQKQQQINYYNAMLQQNSHTEFANLQQTNDLGVYHYKVENFSSFGTISCNAESMYGQSGPCLYHILVAGEYTFHSTLHETHFRIKKKGF